MKKFQEQYIVDEKGQRTAVIFPIEEYEELLEDLHDLAIIAERRDDPTISFEEIRKRLKEDGLHFHHNAVNFGAQSKNIDSELEITG